MALMREEIVATGERTFRAMNVTGHRAEGLAGVADALRNSLLAAELANPRTRVLAQRAGEQYGAGKDPDGTAVPKLKPVRGRTPAVAQAPRAPVR